MVKLATLVCTRIAHLDPILINRALLSPFVRPIAQMWNEEIGEQSSVEGIVVNDASLLYSSPRTVLCSEAQTHRCVRVLHALVTVCPLLPPLVRSLTSSGAAAALLGLYVHGQLACKVSCCLQLAREFCFEYFLVCPGPEAAQQAQRVIFSQLMHEMRPGPNGGIELVKDLASESSTEILISASNHFDAEITTSDTVHPKQTSEDIKFVAQLGFEDMLKTARLHSQRVVSDEAEGRVRQISAAEQIMAVGRASQVIARLLTQFESWRDSRQGHVSTKSGPVFGVEASTATDSKSYVKSADLNESVSGEGGKVASSLFFMCLSEYLHVDEHEAAGQRTGRDSGSSLCEGTFSGLVTMALQCDTPLEALLADGEHCGQFKA